MKPHGHAASRSNISLSHSPSSPPSSAPPAHQPSPTVDDRPAQTRSPRKLLGLKSTQTTLPSQRSSSLPLTFITANAKGPMGNTPSLPRSPISPTSPSKSIAAATTTAGPGNRLRKVFSSRRRKAGDGQEPFGDLDLTEDKAPSRDRQRSPTTPLTPSDSQSVYLHSPPHPLSRSTPLAGEPNGCPHLSPTGLAPALDSPPPPPLPPKSPRMFFMSATPRSAVVTDSPSATPAEFHSPNAPTSNPTTMPPPPRIVPDERPAGTEKHVSSTHAEDEACEHAPTMGVALVRSRSTPSDLEHEKVKEDWRKSDATMSSYHTVRPRSTASGGVRTRPVSMADSLQSTSTIMASSRRLSALFAEAEFVMAETNEESHRSRRPSVSAKTRKRHSISVHISSPFTSAMLPPHPPPASEGNRGNVVKSKPVESAGPVPVTQTSPPPSDTRTAAQDPLGGTQNETTATSPIRGRPAAWTPAHSSVSLTAVGAVGSSWLPSQTDMSKSARRAGVASVLRKRAPAPPPASRQPSASASHLSTTGGVLGFGKRAMERMGRALIGLGSNSNNPSNGPHSDASSSSSSAAVNGVPDDWTARAGKLRRTPNAPSGTWSISTANTGMASTSSTSGSEGPMGPGLGKRVRSPMASRGLVFGQPLMICVRATALDSVRTRLAEVEDVTGMTDPGVDAALDQRLLPVLVVRCVDHIMRWGLEEEGLFRVNGGASHVAKLRGEFDSGADYDLTESPPGDLDPHAVASIFKAYLRELPEPILTKELGSLFEAAMNAENDARKSVDYAGTPPPSASRMGMRGPSLPSNPRDARALMKAPSLTTLAMPSFAGIRPPSAQLLEEFALLIARLPRANRDLLRTVVELIRATAARRETRMPLSNLTVVFCPSLNMSPSILRVLCESDEIWKHTQNLGQPPSPVQAESLKTSPSDTQVNDELLEPVHAVPVVPTTSSSVDDGSSFVSADEYAPSHLQDREPWPLPSSPSSSSLATPDSTSEGPPAAPETDLGDEMDMHAIRVIDIAPPKQEADICLPPVVSLDAEPSTQASPMTRLLDSTSSESSLVSVKTSGTGKRAFPTISGPILLPQTAPVTPVSDSPVIGPPSFDPFEHGGGAATAPHPRPTRPSLTALFSKRSFSSLRSSRILSSLSPLSPRSTCASPTTPQSPDGSMFTAPQTGSHSALPSPVLASESRLDPSPSNKPQVFREIKNEPNHAQHRSDLERFKRRNEHNGKLPVAAASLPNLIPSGSDFAQDEQPPLPPLVKQDANSHLEIAPMGDLPEPYNRLSLWEDVGDDVITGEWASSVLLAADAGWLATSSANESN